MAFSRKNQALLQEREAKKNKALEVMGQFTRCCQVCNVASSKTRIYELRDGLFCGKEACLPNGMNPFWAEDQEKTYKAHLEAERNKPRPESFGEWA